MHIIRNIKRTKFRHSAVALGTFDGVHLGHKKLLERTVRWAKKNHLRSVAITFDPHPQELVSPKRGLRLLTTLEEREDLIARSGIDALAVIKFTKKLRRFSYKRFVEEFVIGALSAKAVFAGYDFAFGKGRRGGIKDLRELGEKYGFILNVQKKVVRGGHVVKSSTIRDMISRENFNEGIKLLGHPYMVSGRVVKGAGRGRELGFPTANLDVPRNKLLPAHGVYLAEAKIGLKNFPCLVNIGDRPTFPDNGKLFEVHVLRFKKNILGRVVSAALKKRMRPEIQFSDVEELKKQIGADVARAERIFRFTF